MFQIFKSKTMNTEKLIKKIHADFDSASDKLVKEAQSIINSHSKKELAKEARLSKLGFTNSKDNNKILMLKKANENLGNINYFKSRYPLNKFITESEVERLCKKWGLVFGDATQYKGFVPEKNLSQMESFVLLKEDYVEARVTISDIMMMNFRQYSRFGEEVREKESKKEKPAFKIVASIKDMNMEGYNQKGYKLEKHIPDPIVLQPVKNGYLIVTAWGDEASDPIVVNEINN